MKASGQFQKKPAPTVSAIPLTTNLFRSRRSPAPTSSIAQPSSQPDLNLQARNTPDWNRIFSNHPRPAAVQTKLTVGAPNDVYEQEADRVADQVMSMPDSATQQPVQREATPEEDEVQTKQIAASITPLVQREVMPEEEEVQAKAIGTLQREDALEEEEIQTKSLGSIQREELPEEEEIQTKEIGTLQREEMPEEEEIQTKSLGSIQREELPEEEEVQTKSLGRIQREEALEEEEIQTKPALQRATDGSLQAGSSIESRLNSSKGGGSPLPDDVRSFMEPRFGADFSQVRVHTGSEAVQLNQELSAQAFTHKQDVYFGAGKAPGKNALTAHELTHVVQQSLNHNNNIAQKTSGSSSFSKSIKVDLSSQNLYAFNNDDQVYSFNCVSGDGAHPTPTGFFSILKAYPKT